MDWIMPQGKRPKKRRGVAIVSPPNSSEDDDFSLDSPQIRITSRDNHFVSKTWWMVDMEDADDSNEGSLQGATPLVKRCMRAYNWDLQKTRRVLKAYRQFLFLKKHYKDWNAEHLSPSLLVDQMWHQHILDVVNYCHDMMMLCGHVVGHNPDGALDTEGKKKRDLMTREALGEHFDGYDGEIWGIQENDDAESDEDKDSACAEDSDLSADANVGSNREMDDGGDVIDDSSDDEGFADDAKVAFHAGASRGTKAKDEMINIKIRFQGVDTPYTVRKTSPLSDCFKAFAGSQGKIVSQFEFKYVDKRIDGRSSPNSLHYKEYEECYFNGKGCIFASLKAGNVPPKAEEMLTNSSKNQAITVSLKYHDGSATFFKVRRSTLMDKIFTAFAARIGVDKKSLRFLLNSERVDPDDTPSSLYLEDQDQIDVILEQSGC